MFRVLLVDDDRGFASALKQRATGIGCDVRWLTHPDDCFTVASDTPPHLIFLADVVAGRRTLELCSALARDPKLGSIPVVVLFRTESAELRAHQALATKAHAYVKKTPDMAGALQELWRAIDREERLARARLGPPPSSLLAESGEPVDLSDLDEADATDEPRSDATRASAVPDARPALGSIRPDPERTLEVVYEPTSQPAPLPITIESLEARVGELERELLRERTRFEARIAELTAEKALLERTASEQAAYIEALEGEALGLHGDADATRAPEREPSDG